MSAAREILNDALKKVQGEAEDLKLHYKDVIEAGKRAQREVDRVVARRDQLTQAIEDLDQVERSREIEVVE